MVKTDTAENGFGQDFVDPAWELMELLQQAKYLQLPLL